MLFTQKNILTFLFIAVSKGINFAWLSWVMAAEKCILFDSCQNNQIEIVGSPPKQQLMWIIFLFGLAIKKSHIFVVITGNQQCVCCCIVSPIWHAHGVRCSPASFEGYEELSSEGDIKSPLCDGGALSLNAHEFLLWRVNRFTPWMARGALLQKRHHKGSWLSCREEE